MFSCNDDDNDTLVQSFHSGDVVPESYLSKYGYKQFFSSSTIPDTIFQLMQGKSFKADCTVPRDSLRYILCLHKDINGKSIVG